MPSLAYSVIKPRRQGATRWRAQPRQWDCRQSYIVSCKFFSLDSMMQVEGSDGCCSSMLSCFHRSQGERSPDEWGQAGEDMREEVLFDLSLDGQRMFTGW